MIHESLQLLIDSECLEIINAIAEFVTTEAKNT